LQVAAASGCESQVATGNATAVLQCAAALDSKLPTAILDPKFQADFNKKFKTDLGLLTKDALALAAVGLLAFVVRRQKALLLLLIPLVLASSYFYYFQYLRQSAGYTAPAQQNIQPASISEEDLPELAPDGEIFVKAYKPADLEIIRRILTPWKVTLEPAFPQVADTASTLLDDYYKIDIPAEFAGAYEQIQELLINSGRAEDVALNEIFVLSEGQIPLNGTILSSGTAASVLYPVNDPLADSMGHWPLLHFQNFIPLLAKRQPVRKAKIAILDTGIDANHEDLKELFVSSGQQHDRDVVGHGTHCAGIAAAVTNNGIGIGSFCGNRDWVQITSVKVLNDFGAGTQQSILAGLITAADGGADVISMSLGGPRNALSQRLYNEAIQYANRKGAIVVVAAGNDSRKALRVVPAASPYAITVTAVDENGQKAGFSNFFENSTAELGLAAPGTRILSTLPGNRYGRMNGTSMAAPCVAGLVALLKALQPDLTTRQAFELLYQTGAETPNTLQTGRLVQPDQLLSAFPEKAAEPVF
jgi:thermitase